MRKPPVQHEVYEHPCDADVHPERPGPPCDGAMAVIAATQPAAQRNDDHGDDHDGERHVWNQHDQINDVPEAAAQEADITHVRVKIQIASQEQSRGDNGGNHTRAMCGDFSPHDQAAPGEQENRTASVQAGDKGREVGVLLGDHAAGLVVRRLAIKNASPNITRENRSKVAIAEGSGKVASIPG